MSTQYPDYTRRCSVRGDGIDSPTGRKALVEHTSAELSKNLDTIKRPANIEIKVEIVVTHIRDEVAT